MQVQLAALVAVGSALLARAQAEVTPDAPGLRCAAENDPALRLACYDRIYRPAPQGDVPPGALSLAATAPASPPSSELSRFWELEADDKRGTYLVKTYHPNYLLPLHATSRLNASPRTPTQFAPGAFAGFGRYEAKLQLSLRMKVARNVLVDGADVWFAYTQRSLAQPWNRDDSAPFRTTDHQPEVIWVVPWRGTAAPFGWRLRLLQAGYTHESNGATDPLSRSWDRLFIAAAAERGDLSLLLRLNKRIYASGGDNPDIPDFVGRAALTATWAPGPSRLSATWRHTLKRLDRGSLLVDWSYPVDVDQPAGLRWMLQLFYGYGETLVDYNHRQARAGVGLALFQF